MSEQLATTTAGALVNYSGGATLMEMRADDVRFPRIKDIPAEQAIGGMARIVSQAFLYRGQTADPTTVKFISTALVTELQDGRWHSARGLSLAEIQVIVKRAVLGDAEMFGISVSSLFKVILDYVKSGEFQDLQRRVYDQREKAEQERRHIQKLQEFKQSLLAQK